MVTQKLILLQFPIKAFPRYKYTIDIVTKFIKRCQKLFQACGLSEKAIPEFKDVLVQKFVVGVEPDDYIKQDVMMFKKVDNVQNLGDVSENGQLEESANCGTVVVNVASEAALDTAQIVMTRGRLWMIVLDEDMLDGKITRTGDAMIYYTTRARFAKNLCDLLELHVFRSLKERVDVLRTLSANPGRSDKLEMISEEQIPSDIKQYFKRLLEKYHQINTSVDTSSENQAIIDKPTKRPRSGFKMEDLINELSGLDISDSNKANVAGVSADLGNMEKIKKHLDIVSDSKVQRKIADLDGESQAMYTRSNVPEAEQPDIHLKFEPTKEEVPRDIFAGVPEATGCGYRLGVFIVYTKKSSNTPKQTLSSKIKSILQGHGIEKFELHEDEGDIQPLCRHSVGNNVLVTNPIIRNGTLGGFATMSSQLHILSARHVLIGRGDVSVSVDNNPDVSITIARIKIRTNPLPETAQKLDIAVAKVDNDKVNTCERRFKDKDGNPQNSVLYEEGRSQIKVLDKLPVFIWGAVSKPGAGTIVMPELFRPAPNDGMEKYIAIESEEDGEAVFCQEGDSGAIVCAEDPDGRHVNVISMLMGQSKKSFMSFQLLAGINQLNLEHSGQFTIC